MSISAICRQELSFSAISREELPLSAIYREIFSLSAIYRVKLPLSVISREKNDCSVPYLSRKKIVTYHLSKKNSHAFKFAQVKRSIWTIFFPPTATYRKFSTIPRSAPSLGGNYRSPPSIGRKYRPFVLPGAASGCHTPPYAGSYSDCHLEDLQHHAIRNTRSKRRFAAINFL